MQSAWAASCPCTRANTHLHRPCMHRFYWHSLSHYLGMDTHDTALISHSRPLLAGSIITIEPGLYIPDEERFGVSRGLGVRIEDDVLLTSGGNEVLSCGVPTSPDEIERMVGSSADL